MSVFVLTYRLAGYRKYAERFVAESVEQAQRQLAERLASKGYEFPWFIVSAKRVESSEAKFEFREPFQVGE